MNLQRRRRQCSRYVSNWILKREVDVPQRGENGRQQRKAFRGMELVEWKLLVLDDCALFWQAAPPAMASLTRMKPSAGPTVPKVCSGRRGPPVGSWWAEEGRQRQPRPIRARGAFFCVDLQTEWTHHLSTRSLFAMHIRTWSAMAPLLPPFPEREPRHAASWSGALRDAVGLSALPFSSLLQTIENVRSTADCRELS